MNALNKIAILCMCFALPAIATYVAVLETVTGTGDVTLEEKLYLTDVLRSEAVSALPAEKNYIIMTRENINAMLPPGKVIEDCEGSCIVETGKNISADYVAQGRVGKFADNLTITVELYETASSKLMGSFSAKALDMESIENEIRQKSHELFSRIISSEYGLVDLQPYFVGKTGNIKDLIVKIDGNDSEKDVKYGYGLWKLSSGEHLIEFSHRCYEPLMLKVNVFSGKTTIVNSALVEKKGLLSLSAEFEGKERKEPVFLNGVLLGATPLRELVPVCARVEIGKEKYREIIEMAWAGKDRLNVVYNLKRTKMSFEEYESKKRLFDDNANGLSKKTQLKKSIKVLSIVVVALGFTSIGLGVYNNAVLKQERENYENASKGSDFTNQWNRLESAQKERNVFYGIGLGLIGLGTVFYFAF